MLPGYPDQSTPIPGSAADRTPISIEHLTRSSHRLIETVAVDAEMNRTLAGNLTRRPADEAIKSAHHPCQENTLDPLWKVLTDHDGFPALASPRPRTP